MKKLQLSIVILSLLWVSSAVAAVFTGIPSNGINSAKLDSLHNVRVPVKSNVADFTFLYPGFDPDFALHPYIFSDVGTEDINLDTDIDTTDSAEKFGMNDRGALLTTLSLEDPPILMVRSFALNVFNFPPEVSRLRI